MCLSVSECVCVVMVYGGGGGGGFKPLEQCHPVDRALLCDYVLIRGAMGTQRDQEADFPSLFFAECLECEQAWGTRTTHTRASTGRHVRILPIFSPPRFFFSPLAWFFSRNDR